MLDEDSKNRAFVLKVILCGTLFVIAAITVLLGISLFTGGGDYVKARLFLSIGLFAYLCVVALLVVYFRAYKAAAPMFVLFYTAVAAGCIWEWGAYNIFGILLLELTIVLAGIVLRPRLALLMACAAALVLSGTHFATLYNYRIPRPTEEPTIFGQILGYSLLFLITAVLCWLYSNQMYRSLRKAERAELLLRGQKANLEKIVQKRTADLEAKRLQELENMNRFTQVSTLSTGLLHDLANYLTVLTIDIQNLHSRNNSVALERASQTIHYIDTMVDGVRKQLQGEVINEPFDIAAAITVIVNILQHKAADAGVRIDWQPPSPAPTQDAEQRSQRPAGNRQSLKIFGDVTRFNQIMTVLISNAIEAYDHGATDATVQVGVRRQNDSIIITVEDHGRGLSIEQREHLFKPFTSTKKDGMGIGLFLVKQIIETHFKGSVILEPSFDHTVFTVSVPVHS